MVVAEVGFGCVRENKNNPARRRKEDREEDEGERGAS